MFEVGVETDELLYITREHAAIVARWLSYYDYLRKNDLATSNTLWWLWEKPEPSEENSSITDFAYYLLELLVSKEFKISLSHLILMLIYIDRYLAQKTGKMANGIMNTILLISYLVADKFYMHDVSYSNEYYAEYAKLSIKMIKSSEYYFLKDVNFNLWISPETFNFAKEKVMNVFKIFNRDSSSLIKEQDIKYYYFHSNHQSPLSIPRPITPIKHKLAVAAAAKT
jgi:hypothetical protein